MKPIRFIMMISTVAIISGCSTLESIRPDIEARPLPSRLDEMAYINSLREAFVIQDSDMDDLCFDGEGLKPFKDKSAQGFSETNYHEEKLKSPKCVKFKKVDKSKQGDTMREYLLSGFGLTDLYCQRFFTIATASERNRRFGQSSFNSWAPPLTPRHFGCNLIQSA